MNISIYQIFIPLFCIYILFRVILHYRRGTYTLGILIMGILLWGGIALLALFPTLSNGVTKVTGIKSNIDAVVFLALLVLFLFIFRLSLQMEYLRRDITNLVREDALREFMSTQEEKLKLKQKLHLT